MVMADPLDLGHGKNSPSGYNVIQLAKSGFIWVQICPAGQIGGISGLQGEGCALIWSLLMVYFRI